MSAENTLKCDPEILLKILYYIVFLYICFVPGLRRGQLSESSFIQGWRMYSGAYPLCTVRFINPANPENTDFHRLVTGRLMPSNWGKSPGLVVLKSEAAARRFIGSYCRMVPRLGPAQFDLSCYSNEVWIEAARKEYIPCL